MEITKQFRTPDRLTEMIRNIRQMEYSIAKGEKTLEIPKLEWVYPLSLLPLVVYANNNCLSIKYTGDNLNIKTYLDAVSFPSGTEDLSLTDGHFLPITKVKCGCCSPILENYEDRILNLVSEEFRGSFINGLKLLTSELQNNVEEHAKIDHYWIFAQYWKKTKTCEICLADTGIGYKESYKGTKNEVATHADAIKNALKGISSKTPDERGAGLANIQKMFIDGYKGEMVIMTGDALLYRCKENPILFGCPVQWKGAYVGLKFTLKNIDASKYY